MTDSADIRADNDMQWAYEKAVNDVFDIVRDLPEARQKQLIQDYFGDDFYDYYLEWFEGD